MSWHTRIDEILVIRYISHERYLSETDRPKRAGQVFRDRRTEQGKDNQPLNLNRNQSLIIFSYFFNSNGTSDAGEKLLPLNFHILNKKKLNEFKVASIYINVIACGISQYVYKRIVTFL